MKKPTKTPAAVKAAPRPSKAAPGAADHEAAGKPPAVSERDVAEHENDTLVVETAGPHREPVKREPSAAEREAIAAHMELRVAELAAYCRTEAAKYDADPRQLAHAVAKQLRDAFDRDED